MGSLVQKQRDKFEVSKATRGRVQRRYELQKQHVKNFTARRRNFAPAYVKALRIGRMVGRALWQAS